jgi:PAS domain S-box-containing protein
VNHGMTSPASNGGRELGSTGADRRHKVARKWAYLVSLTAYLPLSYGEVERELLGLVNSVFDAILCEPVPDDRIQAVGARLVELNCVGKASLQCTVDVLAGALFAEPELRRFDRLPERVAHVVGALAAGHAEAVRSTTMDQQDNLHRALLEAMWQTEHRLRASEARLSAVLTCSASGIAITDLDGRFVRANSSFDRIVERPGAQSGRDSLFDLVGADDSPGLREAYRDLLTGKLPRLALRPKLLGPNGKAIPVSLTASLVRGADGRANDYVTIIVEDTGTTSGQPGT